MSLKLIFPNRVGMFTGCIGICAGAAILLFGCSSGDSKSSSAGSSDAAAVARRAVQALIDQDNDAYLNELRPEDRSDPAHAPDPNQNLRGCVIKDVSKPEDVVNQNTTVRFSTPCGPAPAGSPSKPFVGCSLSMVVVGGTTYLRDYVCSP